MRVCRTRIHLDIIIVAFIYLYLVLKFINYAVVRGSKFPQVVGRAILVLLMHQLPLQVEL